jgi:membrane-bound metal-dependent hydrolase YbcI (DUF457 family)
MPFTLSHPAAALPFLRTRLIPSALVIGSMVPDFEYFLRLSPKGGFGHTLPGVFLFDLPVAFISLWLFHAFLKEPLYSWLPLSVQQRISLDPSSSPIQSPANLALALLSILIGIATHILWDSFTHRGFWPYRHWLFLHRTIPLPDGFQLEYLRIIQHVSTAVGAAVLLLWLRNWYRRTTPNQPALEQSSQRRPRASLLLISLVALTAAIFRAFAITGDSAPESITGDKYVFERAVITGITVFWCGVLAYGVFRARARGQMRNA